LKNVELISVVKLEPFLFTAEARSPPSGIYEDMPEEWYRYGVHSLAEADARMEVAGDVVVAPIEHRCLGAEAMSVELALASRSRLLAVANDEVGSCLGIAASPGTVVKTS
jgi:hypothetical protein